jgi:sulfoxide reductase heme-binding subunit YedZ
LKTQTVNRIKDGLFAACLLPLALLAVDAWQHRLGANPIEAVTHATGEWTLRLLLITLAMTPLRRLTGWHWLIRFRRMFGLFAFFYACLHLVTYVWLDQFFLWGEMLHDIVKRPFITAGFAAFILLIPLAATSTNRMMHRLGKRWLMLHRLAYVIPTLGVLHFLWLVKADITDPVIYAAILIVLLGFRVVWARRQRALPTIAEMNTP